jgi:hypothetical protein
MAIKNKKRHTITKLSDLLPEILIEAQGCDEVTALAALRRAYEGLCVSYGFDEQDLWVTLGEKDRDEDGSVSLELDSQEILQVESVSRKSEYGTIREMPFSYDGDVLRIEARDLPDQLETNGHRLGIKITATFMPNVDDEFRNTATVTKWRLLIVAKTLEDLFSMEGQRWTSAARYQVYANRADKLLEDYLIYDKYYQGKHEAKSSASSPSMNIFC